MENKDIFSSQKRESTVDFIINYFKDLLISKKLKPGDSIPNENELAESLNVSRGSIREAMKILSAFGIVEIRRGDGTYIAKSIGKTLLDPFLFSLIMSDADTKELVELRELIEYQVIKLIVKNSGAEEIDEIERACFAMKEFISCNPNVNDSILIEYDLEFHRALGRATKNILVEKIYNFILELFSPYIESTYSYAENGMNAAKLHEDILNYLKAGDIDGAMEATGKSIEEWRRRLSIK